MPDLSIAKPVPVNKLRLTSDHKQVNFLDDMEAASDKNKNTTDHAGDFFASAAATNHFNANAVIDTTHQQVCLPQFNLHQEPSAHLSLSPASSLSSATSASSNASGDIHELDHQSIDAAAAAAGRRAFLADLLRQLTERRDEVRLVDRRLYDVIGDCMWKLENIQMEPVAEQQAVSLDCGQNEHLKRKHSGQALDLSFRHSQPATSQRHLKKLRLLSGATNLTQTQGSADNKQPVSKQLDVVLLSDDSIKSQQLDLGDNNNNNKPPANQQLGLDLSSPFSLMVKPKQVIVKHLAPQNFVPPADVNLNSRQQQQVATYEQQCYQLASPTAATFSPAQEQFVAASSSNLDFKPPAFTSFLGQMSSNLYDPINFCKQDAAMKSCFDLHHPLAPMAIRPLAPLTLPPIKRQQQQQSIFEHPHYTEQTNFSQLFNSSYQQHPRQPNQPNLNSIQVTANGLMEQISQTDAAPPAASMAAPSTLMVNNHRNLAFKCHVCGNCFEDKHRLQQHLSIHLNLHPSWFEEKTIKETMAQYELRRGDYLCTTCQIRCDTTVQFDKHMQMHGDKPHQCELCSQDNKLVSFRYFRQLLTHLRSHCFLYSCKFVPECKQTANRKDYLKLHILKHHLNNNLPKKYTICCH